MSSAARFEQATTQHLSALNHLAPAEPSILLRSKWLTMGKGNIWLLYLCWIA